MTYANPEQELKLVISIGANIPSKFGNPLRTITAMRPNIESNILEWNADLDNPKNKIQGFDNSLSFTWAPLYETFPLGGPKNQPKFINTVLVVDWKKSSSVKPNEKAAIDLMKRFLDLEKSAGRERTTIKTKWEPRSLDIDFISWGGLQVNSEILILPHSRSIERNFVLIPLTEVLSKSQGKPKRMNSQSIWPE